MKNNSKYLLLCLKERNGAYEYLHRSVHELTNSRVVTANRFAENYAKRFYGDNVESEDEGHYFFGGEVFVTVDWWQFVSEQDFNILTHYL